MGGGTSPIATFATYDATRSVVLGNVGDGRDPEVDATLRRYLVDPDELLRAHACWACAQLGRTDLLVLVEGDESALVLAEL